MHASFIHLCKYKFKITVKIRGVLSHTVIGQMSYSSTLQAKNYRGVGIKMYNTK